MKGKMYEIESLELEYAKQLAKYEELSKVVATLQSRQKERGKSLNRLWEENKKLKNEITTLQKYCGKLTYNLSVIQLENRIDIRPINGVDCPNQRFLVRDVLKQLINQSGYNLEYELLQIKYPTPSLTIKEKK